MCLQCASNLHSSQREDAVEFILARLDRSGVHECIIKLDKQRNKHLQKSKETEERQM